MRNSVRCEKYLIVEEVMLVILLVFCMVRCVVLFSFLIMFVLGGFGSRRGDSNGFL